MTNVEISNRLTNLYTSFDIKKPRKLSENVYILRLNIFLIGRFLKILKNSKLLNVFEFCSNYLTENNFTIT